MAKPTTDKPWFVSAFDWLYDGWNFAQLLGASGFGVWASYAELEGATPLAPWLLLLFSILTGWALVRIARQVWQRVRIAFDRPHVVVEIETGSEKASMEIGHFGAPVAYSATGRIVRTLDGAVTPKPTRNRFQCELQLAEGRPDSQTVILRDGEWAHIVLADQIQNKQLNIRRGTYGRRFAVPDSGVEVEIVLTAHPRSAMRPISKSIHITREGSTIRAVAVGD